MDEMTLNHAVRRRLEAKGLALPRPWQLPEEIPAALVKVVDTHAWVSAHVPLTGAGHVAEPLGRVGAEVDMAAAQQAAVRSLLGLVAGVEQALGDLGRIRAWVRLFCMANAAPGFDAFPAVFNPASQLLIDLFGDDVGRHARAAIGVAGLPWNVPVEIQAELELWPS